MRTSRILAAGLAAIALSACDRLAPAPKLITELELVRVKPAAELLEDCPIAAPAEDDPPADLLPPQSEAAIALADAIAAVECYRAKLDGIRRELER